MCRNAGTPYSFPYVRVPGMVLSGAAGPLRRLRSRCCVQSGFCLPHRATGEAETACGSEPESPPHPLPVPPHSQPATRNPPTPPPRRPVTAVSMVSPESPSRADAEVRPYIRTAIRLVREMRGGSCRPASDQRIRARTITPARSSSGCSRRWLRPSNPGFRRCWLRSRRIC